MLSANFEPKRTAAVSRGFLATARLSCLFFLVAGELFPFNFYQFSFLFIFSFSWPLRYAGLFIVYQTHTHRFSCQFID